MYHDSQWNQLRFEEKQDQAHIILSATLKALVYQALSTYGQFKGIYPSVDFCTG